jgi:hypothetical protein
MLGGQAVTNSSHYILNRPARWRVIENLGGGDERKGHNAPPARAAAPPGHFVFAPMAGHHAIEPIAKSIAEIACDAVGLDLTHHQILVATPECNQSSGGRGQILDYDLGFA